MFSKSLQNLKYGNHGTKYARNASVCINMVLLSWYHMEYLLFTLCICSIDFEFQGGILKKKRKKNKRALASLEIYRIRISESCECLGNFQAPRVILMLRQGWEPQVYSNLQELGLLQHEKQMGFPSFQGPKQKDGGRVKFSWQNVIYTFKRQHNTSDLNNFAISPQRPPKYCNQFPLFCF